MRSPLHIAIDSRRLLADGTFAGLDFNQALDQRDQSIFDQHWVTAHERFGFPLDPPDDEVMRKAVFLRTCDLDAEDIAPEVSDDFGLIHAYLVSGLHDPFVSGMFSLYTQGQFPTGQIRLDTRSIAAILAALP